MTDIDTNGPIDLEAHAREVVGAHERAYGHLQRADSMSAWELRQLQYFMTRHFASDAKLHTVETGCGAATVEFSQHSTKHTVFCTEDRSTANFLIDAITGTAGFNPSTVEFVCGTGPERMFSHSLPSPVDIALIGGVRSFPFPETEYLAISRWLKSGSILAIRDVHIPSMQQLVRHLTEDDNFVLSSILENTAFFWCASPPNLGHEPAAWWTQRYNAQRFPVHDPNAYSIGQSIPFTVSFDGWLKGLPPYLKRGHMLRHGRPITGGPQSTIEFTLDQPITDVVEIEIIGDRVAPEDRILAVTAYVNGVEHGSHQLTSGLQTLKLTVDAKGAKNLDVRLYHSGVPALSDLAWPTTSMIEHQSVLALRSITVRCAQEKAAVSHPQGTDISQMDGAVVTFDFRGIPLNFFVHDRHDSIQAHHAAGQLYEIEELDLLAKHIKPDARILDVGANIGNHTVWFEKIAKAATILVIEPQPRIIKLLKLNSRLNGLRNVDLSCLGCALGRASTRGSIRIPQAFNPAGGVIEHDPAGEIPIRSGDEVVGDAVFDFVKVDVEGAEMEVLEGLRGMIDRCRPLVFVEVWNENAAAFASLLDDIGYEIIAEFRRYDIATNLLIRHKTLSGT